MKLYNLFGFSFLIATLASCNLTENIYVNDNGTGKFSLEIDASSLIALGGEELDHQMITGGKKNVDSTFTFKQLFEDKKDSIAKLSPEAQEEFKKLEGFVVKTKINPEKKECLITLSTDFKNVNEVQDAIEALIAIKKLDDGLNLLSLSEFSFLDNGSKPSYTYDGKKFTRRELIDKKRTAEKTNDSDEETSEMIFASSNYILKYHFPKRIKRVSNPNALFSEDRKSITIQYSLTDYIKNPEKFNFDVEFEK